MSPGCAGMFSVPPLTPMVWSGRITVHAAPSWVPSKSSTSPPAGHWSPPVTVTGTVAVPLAPFASVTVTFAVNVPARVYV